MSDDHFKVGSKEKLFHDFSLRLGLTKEFEEAFSVFEEFVIDGLGFDSALYSYMPSIVYFNKEDPLLDSSSPLFWVSNAYPRKYLEVYSERGFLEFDPIVKAVLAGCTDVLDWDEVQKGDDISPEGQVAFNVAKHDYNMHHGLTVPTFYGRVGVAAVSVLSHQSDYENFVKLKNDNLSYIISASHLLNAMVTAQRFDKTIFTFPVLPKFNETQRKVIKGLLQGLSVPKIAEQIHRSPKHIENTVRDMRIKLGGYDENRKPKMSKDLFIYFCTIMNLDDEFFDDFMRSKKNNK